MTKIVVNQERVVVQTTLGVPGPQGPVGPQGPTGPAGDEVNFETVAAALAQADADVDFNEQRLINILDPTDPQDVATKAYVDAVVGEVVAGSVPEVTDALAGTAPAMAEAAVGSVLLRAGADDPVWRRLTLDDIDPAFAAALSGGTTLEVGASAVNPALTASYTGGPPTSASVSDSDGNPATTLSSPFTDATIARAYTKTANNASVTWTLSAVKGSLTRTATTSTAWRPRVYYGVGVDGLNTETAIEALASSALASSRARSFTVAPGSGEHIYYAFPASYGEAVFTVGGFEGGFELVSDSISVTNSNGVTQSYRLYKSTNPNLGSTTVVVT